MTGSSKDNLEVVTHDALLSSCKASTHNYELKGVRFAEGALQVFRDIPKSLKWLLLLNCELSQSDLMVIGRLPIKHLKLTGSRFDDEGLAHLSGLAKLEFLGLAETSVGDRGIELLAKQALPCLKELDLTRTRITDRGVATLAQIPSLRRLQLGFTQVSDTGLLTLAPLKKLEVAVYHSAVTDAGHAALVRAQRAKPVARAPKAPPQESLVLAREALTRFLTAMADWEMRSHAAQAPLLEELAALAAEHCESGVQPRGVAYSSPPDHDPAAFRFDEARSPRRDVVEIMMTKRTSPNSVDGIQHRFTLVRAEGPFRIRSHEVLVGRWIRLLGAPKPRRA